MIGSLYRAARARRWNRRRRILELLDRESAIDAGELDWVEAMAAQLAEIRTLPEAPAPQR